MKSIKSKTYLYVVTSLLVLMPAFYLLLAVILFPDFFGGDAQLIMFLLYATPMWLVLASIVAAEIYRRRILQKNHPFSLLLFIVLGGCIVTMVAIFINPTGPSLLSHEALWLTGLSVAITVPTSLVLNLLNSRYF